MAWHNLTGQKFNDLVVIGQSAIKFPYSNERVWDCKCLRCGNEKKYTSRSLISGRVKACGCAAKHDLTGKRFDNLTVVERVPGLRNHEVIWKCVCDCTNVCYRSASNLLKKLKMKHCCSVCRRKYKTKDEEILGQRYRRMLGRCYNPNDIYYHNYGGRGIYVCDEWMNNERSFIDWSLSNGFRRDLSIDRIDNNGPYAPWNCRWADKYTQDNNKRTNHYVVVDGVKMSLAEWGREIDVDRSQIYSFSDKYNDNDLIDIIRKFLEINDINCNCNGKVETLHNRCRKAGMSDNDIANFLECHRAIDLLYFINKGVV